MLSDYDKKMFKKIEKHNSETFDDIYQGFIKKKILEKGYGSNHPKVGDVVYADIIGEIYNDGRTCENSYMAKEPKQIIIGGDDITYGLEIGIKSMSIGEKSLIYVEPEYGYLPLSNYRNKTADKKFMDTSLELSSELKETDVEKAKNFYPIVYEVEIIFIDCPRKNKTTLNTKEKMEISSELKEKGINSFKSKNFQEAEKYFCVALEYLDKIPSLELNLILDLKHSLILNICNCLINQSKFNYALSKINEAIKIKITAKCYYYLAYCNIYLANFEASEKAIEKFEDYMPGDPLLKDLKQRLFETKEKYTKKTSNLLKTSMSKIYDDKSINESIFPSVNTENNVFYIDILVNNDKSLPIKLKFEIYDKKSKNFLSGLKLTNSTLNYKLVNNTVNLELTQKYLEISSYFDFKNDENLRDIIDEYKRKYEVYNNDLNQLLSNKISDNNSKKFLYKKNNIYPCVKEGLLCLKLSYDYENQLNQSKDSNEKIINSIKVSLIISLNHLNNELENIDSFFNNQYKDDYDNSTQKSNEIFILIGNNISKQIEVFKKEEMIKDIKVIGNGLFN